MSTDSATNDFTESSSLPADVDDDTCRLQLIEIVPLTRDTDSHSAIECDSGDWDTEVKPEILPVTKHDPVDVYRLQFVAVVPLTSDTDSPSTTECDNGDKQDILPVVKQEPADLHVSCAVILYCVVHKPLQVIIMMIT